MNADFYFNQFLKYGQMILKFKQNETTVPTTDFVGFISSF